MKFQVTELKNLIQSGYLKFAAPEEALNCLTIPLLKEILRENNQKLSGNKSSLVERIIKNIAPEKYSARVPKVYSATEIGRRELQTRWAYMENRREMYGFLNSEIAALETQGNDSEKILENLFARNIITHGANHDFGLLRNDYFYAHKFFKKRGRLIDSITALLSAIYFDLAGMKNNNTVEMYDALSYVFETSLWSELDKLKTALNLSDEELLNIFEDATAAAIKPPFSYFEIDAMKKMILERLRGQMNLLERYENFRNVPQKNNTGCLSVIIFLLVILGTMI